MLNRRSYRFSNSRKTEPPLEALPKRSLWNNVALISALGGIIGISVTGTLSYIQSRENQGSSGRIEICKRAYESLNDESPNPNLTKPQLNEFIAIQLRLAKDCAIREWQ